MDTIEYSLFFKQLKLGVCIDETCFYFADDSNKTEHILGYLPNREKPYWVGVCDIEKGTDFLTAEELVKAPIYDGQTLEERWEQVRILSIEGVSLEDWLEIFVKGGVRRTLKE